MLYLTFHGESRLDKHVAENVSESPVSITIPIVVLEVLAVFGGFFGIPHIFHILPNYMELLFNGFFAKIPGGHGAVLTEWILLVLSVLFALVAWYVASKVYQSGFALASKLREKWEWAYKISLNKWYVDEIYNLVIIRPTYSFTKHFLWRFFDLNVVDGIVNTSGTAARTAANVIRPLQNGLTQNYALIFTIGTFIVLWYLI